MASTVTGFILITDITGYTMFLSESELEHAQEVLQSLLKLLIEKLTQNHVKEETGFQAYALFTRAAVEALELQEWSAGMEAMTESYEHIGLETGPAQPCDPPRANA